MMPTIPEAALQQHVAVLGKTGSGKTFAVKGLVEGLLERGRRVGIVDPTGAWWGLRSSRDGKGPGFPILVLGGDHGDLPLPALGGAAVARLLVDRGVNLVADTSQLTVGERTRWFIDFAGTLYRANRQPMQLVLDEAHNFAPQGKVPDPDTGKMLHAANTLASGGRSRGIRLVMITQRPQKLHKDALTSADTLIAMRVLAPHDREAVRDWIRGCGDEAQGRQVLDSLAGLQKGEGWAWYPEGGFLRRLKFPAIGTFDSSATPTDGGTVQAPRGAAEIDLTEIRAAMADAVREAEANDPKLLRAEIARLKGQLRDREPTEIVKTVPALATEERVALERLVDELDKTGAVLAGALARVVNLSREAPAPSAPATQSAALPKTEGRLGAGRDGLPPTQQRILDTINMLNVRRLEPTRERIARWLGIHPNGGRYGTDLAALRGGGLLEGCQLTPAGRSLVLPMSTGPEAALAALPDEAMRRMMATIAKANGTPFTRETLAAALGIHPNGGRYNTGLGRLRQMGLISERGPITATDAFIF